MPRQNRVTPFGSIVAVSARGTLTGNRGCLHDDRQNIRRQFQGTRWIICLLDFKGRQRSLMTPGHYTELFFLDEATALAAGHRPCAECRRQDHEAYRHAWGRAHRTTVPRADDMDLVLHGQRLRPDRTQRTHPARLGSLPDGAMLALDGSAWLVFASHLHRWTPGGYVGKVRIDGDSRVDVLTPPATVRTIRAGFRPGVHPSATSG
jgi:hypothetical protein